MRSSHNRFRFSNTHINLFYVFVIYRRFLWQCTFEKAFLSIFFLLENHLQIWVLLDDNFFVSYCLHLLPLNFPILLELIFLCSLNVLQNRLFPPRQILMNSLVLFLWVYIAKSIVYYLFITLFKTFKNKQFNLNLFTTNWNHFAQNILYIYQLHTMSYSESNRMLSHNIINKLKIRTDN